MPGFARYGQLSGRTSTICASGARIEVGEQKRSPLDFALWKGAKPGEPFWASPWGDGPPGLAHRVLGDGAPLPRASRSTSTAAAPTSIFPHHENEIAQSEGAFGDGQFARHWIHSGMVNFGGEKMSKSLGNFVTIRKVAETYDLEALRLHLIGVHYRSPVAFTIARDDKGHARYPEIDEAEARLAYYYRTLDRLAAAPGEDDGGAVVAPADKTIVLFQ